MIADLERTSARVIPEVGRPALEVGGKAAVSIAKAEAARRTGELAESYHLVMPDGEVWNPDGAGGKTLEPEAERATSTAVVIGSTLWRAHYDEFGVPQAPARRTVGKAVDDVDKVVQDALDHYMGELLDDLGF